MNSPSVILYNIITVGCNVPIFKIIILDKKLNITAPENILGERGSFHKFPEKCLIKLFYTIFLQVIHTGLTSTSSLIYLDKSGKSKISEKK